MFDALRTRLRALVPASMLGVWRSFYWWNANRINPARARRTARKIVANGEPIRLEIGSGPRGLLGWTSLDLNIGAHIQHDLTKALPFPDGSIDELYSSHVLEHFTYPHPLLDVVRECHRVLIPGARFRIAVPDASLYLRAYFEPGSFDCEKFCTEDVGLRFRNRLDVVNFIAYLGGDHKYLFDHENLLDLLTEGGFRNAKTRQFDSTIDRQARRHESIYAEAWK
jgi:predicted SAM-dependent methyltransferase